jgi:hypothetical protein
MKERATLSLMSVNSHCIPTDIPLSAGLWSAILSIFFNVTLVDCIASSNKQKLWFQIEHEFSKHIQFYRRQFGE